MVGAKILQRPSRSSLTPKVFALLGGVVNCDTTVVSANYKSNNTIHQGSPDSLVANTPLTLLGACRGESDTDIINHSESRSSPSEGDHDLCSSSRSVQCYPRVQEDPRPTFSDTVDGYRNADSSLEVRFDNGKDLGGNGPISGSCVISQSKEDGRLDSNTIQQRDGSICSSFLSDEVVFSNVREGRDFDQGSSNSGASVDPQPNSDAIGVISMAFKNSRIDKEANVKLVKLLGSLTCEETLKAYAHLKANFRGSELSKLLKNYLFAKITESDVTAVSDKPPMIFTNLILYDICDHLKVPKEEFQKVAYPLGYGVVSKALEGKDEEALRTYMCHVSQLHDHLNSLDDTKKLVNHARRFLFASGTKVTETGALSWLTAKFRSERPRRFKMAEKFVKVRLADEKAARKMRLADEKAARKMRLADEDAVRTMRRADEDAPNKSPDDTERWIARNPNQAKLARSFLTELRRGDKFVLSLIRCSGCDK